MKIAIDINDTYSYCPEFFNSIIKSKDNEIFFITGMISSEVKTAEKLLSDNGVERSDYVKILSGFTFKPRPKDSPIEHFKLMRKYKLMQLKCNNIDVYFDDNPFYVDYIRERSDITVFQTILSKKRLKESETEIDFDFNFQRHQFKYLDQIDEAGALRDSEG